MGSYLENLKEKTVLITGAGRGIGKTIAEFLTSKGWTVVLTDIDEEAGLSVTRELQKQGRGVEFFQADLTKERNIEILFEFIQRHFGRLDALVNNARPKLSHLNWVEGFDEWDLAINVLLKAPALTAKYALPLLRLSDSAAIVNIASTNAFFISHQPLTYHVAKAGLLQLTRFLAVDLGSQGIRVNAICPGLVDLDGDRTPLTEHPVNRTITHLAVPMRRAAIVEEIARAVLFLITEGSSYINGQTLVLDGGLSLNEQFHIAKKAFMYDRDIKE